MAKSRSSAGLITLAVIVLLAAAGGWYYLKSTAPKPPEFSTMPVTRGTVTQVVTATGDLLPVRNVNVSSQISGNILKLYVDWNSPVKKGEVLAELDPSSYQTALRQAQGSLANARASHQLMLANAQRIRSLFQEKLVSQSDLDTAEAQLAQAAAQVQIQSAVNETAEVNLSRCTIYSPIDGTVISRQVDVGNTVAASLSAPTLFVIANDLRSMQIDAAVSEADIGSVEPGQAVNFTVDAYPGRQFHGVVDLVRNSPKTSQNVVIYDTMINVRNDDLKLRPGMTATVSVVVANHADVLRVPNSALRVRLPEGITPLPAAGEAGEAAAPPAGDPDRRKQLQALMAEAGFVRGAGAPSPEVRARMEELAKARGLDLGTFGRGRDRDRNAPNANAPVTRTLYRLAGADPKDPQVQAITVKLGITDGLQTEVLSGLKENEAVVTGIFVAGAKGPAAPSGSPFGGRRGF